MTEARKTLLTWLERRGGSLDDYTFPSRVNYMGHLSTRQYSRLVDEWVGAVDLNVREYGTHSMRRTKASLIYKATGNLRAVQIPLGPCRAINEGLQCWRMQSRYQRPGLAAANRRVRENLKFRTEPIADVKAKRHLA